MGEYKYVTYETLDEGTIARIMLNRPEQRNAQNRGLLVDLNDAFLRGRGRRPGPGRDPRRRGPDVLVGPRHGLQGHRSPSAAAAPNEHPTTVINGGTRLGAEGRMLQEWHYFFENTLRWRNLRKITIAQVHGTVYAAGLMLMWACDLIVAADDVQLRRRRRHPPRDVRRGVLRPPVGVRATQDQGAHAHRRLDRRRRGLPARAWSARCSRRPSSASKTLEFARRIAKLPTMAALLIKESVNQTVDNMGFYNALNACFTMHELNHSHWAEIHESKWPVAEPQDGIASWRDAPPVLPAEKTTVQAATS